LKPLTLWSPNRHEPVSTTPWNESAALDAARTIAREAIDAFSEAELWPAHPDDFEDSGADLGPLTSLYNGAAGVIMGLAALHYTGAVDFDLGLAATTTYRCAKAELDHNPFARGSYMIGIAGPALVAAVYAGDDGAAETFYEDAANNVDPEARELFAGSPGHLHAVRFLYERTGDERWRKLASRIAADLLSDLELFPDDCRLWVQHIYRLEWSAYLGAAHGFAGTAQAVLAARDLVDVDFVEFTRQVAKTARNLADTDGEYVNWRKIYGVEPLPNTSVERYAPRLQWCHGAPGFIVALNSIPLDLDSLFDELLLQAGELIWLAGPPRDDAGLCHGAAGNGWSFLKLYRRTGDGKWLDRARSFAMHALEGIERRRAAKDIPWFSFWTGDVGTAAYLGACVSAVTDLPMIDFLPSESATFSVRKRTLIRTLE
jgi:lantibiotic modifying enzyme